ncbi:MAG: peptide ABC transporter substrate-binding protein [Roseiflexaceae bacterium]|nr:peptide ABC transporter substrate-binding protein [Roseiflexaceae bacterium]
MKSRMFAPRHAALALLLWLLSACQVEGGIPDVPTEASALPALSQATAEASSAALAARSQTWTLGLTEQPDTLTPYQLTATDQRRAAPVSELLFPSPVLTHNYAYTTTGVLQSLPTLDNGGAEMRLADVFLDPSGQITTTTTQVITQVDQLVVTFRWNPELAWSDGRPLTAADSVFAYEYERANPPSAESAVKLAQVSTYTAIDDHTTQAVLQLDYIGPTYFLNYWTPLPRHLLEQASAEQWQEYLRAPIGYGPYMIEQREPGAIRMVQNPHYFGTPPANVRLDVLFGQDLNLLRANLSNGNLDLIYSDRPQTETIDTLDRDAQEGLLKVGHALWPGWEHIDYNLDVPMLQDIRLRRAIAYGTNRLAMTEQLMGAHVSPLDSWVLPFQPEAAPADQLSRYEYNPDQARALLDEMGYADLDGDGIRASPDGLTLTLQLLTTADSPLRAEVARRFSADMRAIGIAIETTEASSTDLFAPEGPLYQRQFELALYSWKAEPNANGLSLWNCNAVPSLENNFQGENFAGWCFRDADMAIRRGATTLDLNERKAQYLRQQQIWTQELPGLPLFQRLSTVALAPGVIGPEADTFAPITWNVAAWRRE